MNTEKFCVFMNYVITQYLMWISNRREIIKHHKVIFSKNKKWKNASLNILTITSTTLSKKRFVNKSRKNVFIFSEFIIIVFTSNFISESTTISMNFIFDSTTTNQFTFVLISVIDESEEKIDYINNKNKINEFTIESTIQTQIKLTTFKISKSRII